MTGETRPTKLRFPFWKNDCSDPAVRRCPSKVCSRQGLYKRHVFLAHPRSKSQNRQNSNISAFHHRNMAPNTDIATRATIVALKAIAGKTSTDIACLLGLSARGVNKIYAKAIERGFDPNVLPIVIKDEYLADAPRSGRPTKQTEDVKDLIKSKVRRDRYGREKSCADIAGELSDAGINISAVTVWRCLRALGFKKTKPTRKPGLTNKMREARLAWCLRYGVYLDSD